MRYFKAALIVLMFGSLAWVASNFRLVADAYTSDVVAVEVQLDGIDLAYELSELSESPYSIERATDTRRRPVALPYQPSQDLSNAPVELFGGEVTLSGTVWSADGAVGNATVRVERHTTSGSSYVDTATQSDGTWALDGLQGGRYRVRAWVPYELTGAASQVAFVADTDEAEFSFRLYRANSSLNVEFLSNGSIYEGLSGTVGVLLSRSGIDAEGIVTQEPISGETVSLSSTGSISVEDARRSGGDGVAWFRVMCDSAGSSTANVKAGGRRYQYTLPPCVVQPEPEPLPEPPTGPDPSGQPPGSSGQPPGSAPPTGGDG